ncbi:MAG: hypothetical protein HGA35_06505 [Erysipelotrichaceae bacterium]|nr:hypothetical protein [Erysipelotrichaceae bacterium]
MIVNRKIKDVLKEITDQNVKYQNTPDKEKRHLKRLLGVFRNSLTEDEQLFLFKIMLEQMHYRNMITDPDNIVQIHNIKLKTITYTFFLTVLGIFITAVLFKVNDSLNGFVDMFGNILKLLAL